MIKEKSNCHFSIRVEIPLHHKMQRRQPQWGGFPGCYSLQPKASTTSLSEQYPCDTQDVGVVGTPLELSFSALQVFGSDVPEAEIHHLYFLHSV